jgi:3-oxoacyl-[acyl-carrier-protein] synthase-1
MRRAVITGLGAVSCIGNTKAEILQSLREGRSGIVANETFAEMGLRSQVSGSCNIDLKEHIDRKVLRFMGDAAAYAYIAMRQAIDDSGLQDSDVSNVMTGLIAGSGGASSSNIVKAADALRARGVRKIGPYAVTKTMSSTVAACLATPYKIKGINYSITSACATSAHCIGAAAEQIAMGKQDIVFAGGGEEEDWTLTALFDAMGALSTEHNDDPARASRPYDAGRDGFVSSSGAGMVVVE